MTNSFLGTASVLCAMTLSSSLCLAEDLNWSGPYVGLQGGLLQGNAAQGFNIKNDPGIFAHSKQSLSGWGIGGHAGFLQQFDSNLVLGVELDASLANFSDSHGQFFRPDFIGPDSSIAGFVDLNWNASARLRAGYAMDRFLPYVAGGIAVADVDYGYNFTQAPITMSGGDLLVGWTLGAGIEYALTDTVSGRFEARHTDYGPGHTVLTGGTRFAIPSRLDLTENRVELGLSLKF
jgi:outer membrane immunogenic protein